MFSEVGAIMRRIWLNLVLGSYENNQIPAERQFLVEVEGWDESAASDKAGEFHAKLRPHVEHLQRKKRRCVWAWGAASDRFLPHLDPNFEPVVQLFAKKVAPLGIGLVHGSSTTGMMGLYDRAWAKLRRALKTAGFAAAQIPSIVTIPLRWVVPEAEQREKAAKNGDKLDRCPPFLRLSDRTEAFALSVEGLQMILLGPGGIGSMFELFWAIAQWQLRKLLLTCFSGWKGSPPPIVILDSYDKEDEEWFYAGVEILLRRMSKRSSAGQENFDHITILRVGVGKDVDGPDRFGARVVYRETIEAAVDEMLELSGLSEEAAEAQDNDVALALTN